MVVYKRPILIEVGVTPGFVANVYTAVLDGTNGKPDWRGKQIIPEHDGFGTMKIGIDYTWDSATGTWTRIKSAFEAGEFFHISFELSVSDTPITAPEEDEDEPCRAGFRQYPHIATIKKSNWASGKTSEITRRCRIEPIRKAGAIRGGFDNEDFNAKFIVFFPLPISTIERGTQLEVYNDEQLEIADIAKHFRKGMLNAQVWI